MKLTLNEREQLHRLALATTQYACEGCNHICESKVSTSLKIADSLRYLMYIAARLGDARDLLA